MQRIIVGLRNKNGKFTIPKFSDCFLEFFGKDINSVTVTCSVENGMLILNESEEGHELRHSPECPIKLSSSFSDEEHYGNSELKAKNIGLAASVVIESSDCHVLLTKRSSHMRASPGVWVFPGGHLVGSLSLEVNVKLHKPSFITEENIYFLELGETVFEAGAREIREETALSISAEQTSVLGFWENVYPLFLGMGTPKYHVLVIYLYIHLNETYEELTKKIIPDPDEVDSYCWLNESVLSKLFTADKNIKCDGKKYVFEDGKIVEKYLDYSSMFNHRLRIQAEPYSGVNFALRKWVAKLISEKPKSKY